MSPRKGLKSRSQVGGNELVQAATAAACPSHVEDPTAALPSLEDLASDHRNSAAYRAEFLSASERAEAVVEMLRVVEAQALALREVARRMQTSPAQVSRLLDTERTGSATLTTLTKFARATGTRLSVLFESEAEREIRLGFIGPPGECAKNVTGFFRMRQMVAGAAGGQGFYLGMEVVAAAFSAPDAPFYVTSQEASLAG